MNDVVRLKPQKRPNRAARKLSANLSEVAYDRLEEAIVSCALAPGQFLSILDLQERTCVGRTPTHLAVSRLAADTLVVVRPRHGLQIAPVDLARERRLLRLRRDLERFVVRLACERASATHRNQLLHISATLHQAGRGIPIDAFSRLDRRIDQTVLAAAGEAFLEHTLRPLRSISRRIGWIYHSDVRPAEGLAQTIDCHLGIIDALVADRAEAAVAATDRLVDFSDSMFTALSSGVDPALFDCNLALRAAG
jgi:DNA-binding GntR family transcriptional regulator